MTTASLVCTAVVVLPLLPTRYRLQKRKLLELVLFQRLLSVFATVYWRYECNYHAVFKIPCLPGEYWLHGCVHRSDARYTTVY